jgi:hypothetical protein
MTDTKSFLAELESSDEYLIESAKFHFAMELKRMMEEANIKNADLAKLLEVKPPMVTKLLRGDANVTIGTMVRACRSVGGKLFIKIARDNCDSRYIEVAKKNFAVYKFNQHESAQRAVGQGAAHAWKLPVPQVKNGNETKSIAA